MGWLTSGWFKHAVGKSSGNRFKHSDGKPVGCTVWSAVCSLWSVALISNVRGPRSAAFSAIRRHCPGSLKNRQTMTPARNPKQGNIGFLISPCLFVIFLILEFCWKSSGTRFKHSNSNSNGLPHSSALVLIHGPTKQSAVLLRLA